MAGYINEEWRKAGDKRFSGHKKQGFTSNHVTPTQYRSTLGKFPVLFTPTGTPYSYVDIPNVPFAGSSHESFPRARNKAWAKMLDKVRDGPAQLGTTLAEGHEALGMIANRASKLYRAYRHLRHGNFRPFLRELAVGAKRKHRNLIRNQASQASSLWLEYSFGWKPMFQDIHDACTALTKPVPGGQGSGSGSEEYLYENVYRSWGQPNYRLTRYTGTAHVKQGAGFYVVNPNLYLLQQVGLANPIQIAWELVPFSFCVDWVFDVGSFLGGFSDLFGMEIINPYCSYTLKCVGFLEKTEPWGTPSQLGYARVTTRKPGFSKPMPNFSFAANLGTSMTRAANAVSLLGQILTK